MSLSFQRIKGDDMSRRTKPIQVASEVHERLLVICEKMEPSNKIGRVATWWLAQKIKEWEDEHKEDENV